MNIEKHIEEFVEKGADIEHQRWVHWQKYMHSKMAYNEAVNPDTGHTEAFYVLKADLYERWERQIDTEYVELSEAEKESDREQVRAYTDLLTATLTAVAEEAKREERKECARQILCQHDIDGEVCECCRANYTRVGDVDMRDSLTSNPPIS
jgi:hypothetical protein